AVLTLGLTLLLAGTLPAQQKPDDIPDAPSATRPTPPPAPPSPRQEAEDASKPDTPPAAASSAGATPGMGGIPRSAPDSTNQNPPPPPMPPIKTVPAGSVPRDADTGEDVGFTLGRVVNLVLVPVTVKDNEGHLVGGLRPKDFSILENGKLEKMTFFTSDPFALSAAVILDTGMADVGLK